MFSDGAKVAKGTTRLASSRKPMRYVFRRWRPAIVTAGPCITSLIHSSPASRWAKRRRSASFPASPSRRISPARESARCTVDGASTTSGGTVFVAGASLMTSWTDSSGLSSLMVTRRSRSSCGSARDRPASLRGLGLSASKPFLRYAFSHVRSVSSATRVRVLPGMA